MNLTAELFERLRALPALIRRAELRVNDLDHLGETLASVVRMHQRSREPEATYVYVLPSRALMMCQVVRLAPAARHWLSFQPHQPLDVGTWIVSVGPARVRTVVVGNQCQSSVDYQGQVCQTKDEAPLGVNLRVELEGY